MLSSFTKETVTKKEAINLLKEQGWTKADAERALANFDFNTNLDQLSILQAATEFSGVELYNRQRLQAAQKGLVTRKQKELTEKEAKIHDLVKQIIDLKENAPSAEFIQLQAKLQALESDRDEILASKDKLKKVNEQLIKDNRDLRNIVDHIKLKLARDMKSLMRYEDSEIRRAVIRLFKQTLE